MTNFELNWVTGKQVRREDYILERLKSDSRDAPSSQRRDDKSGFHTAHKIKVYADLTAYVDWTEQVLKYTGCTAAARLQIRVLPLDELTQNTELITTNCLN